MLEWNQLWKLKDLRAALQLYVSQDQEYGWGFGAFYVFRTSNAKPNASLQCCFWRFKVQLYKVHIGFLFNVLVDAVRRQYLLFTGCLIRQLSVVKLNFLTVFHKIQILEWYFSKSLNNNSYNPILANCTCIFNYFTIWIFSINKKLIPESVLIVCFCLSRCDNITLIYRIPQWSQKYRLYWLLDNGYDCTSNSVSLQWKMEMQRKCVFWYFAQCILQRIMGENVPRPPHLPINKTLQIIF